MNSNLNRNLSSSQPQDLLRIKRIEQIKGYIANGLETEARLIDERFKVGYFKQLEEDARPKIDKLLSKFVTQDPELLKLKEQVRILADIQDSVIIFGESGTGKELIARAIHSFRSSESFVSINCAGLPEHLIESELFGHVKGAFTGATIDKEGLFQEAENGSVFLDEIGELPLMLQAKLLRVLQENTVRPVGSNKEREINCRFICATHCNLLDMCKQKRFRWDLFYRISAFTLFTKPIALRLNDIPLIIKSLEQEDELEPFPTDKVDWRLLAELGLLNGNVRSIQHIVRRWQVLKELPSAINLM